MNNSTYTFTGEAKVSIRNFWAKLVTNAEKRINRLNKAMTLLEPQADVRWHIKEIAREQQYLEQYRKNLADLS